MRTKQRGKYRKNRTGSYVTSGLGILDKWRVRYETKANDEIRRCLEKHGFVKQRAADELGINRTTLVEWCRRHAPELINKE